MAAWYAQYGAIFPTLSTDISNIEASVTQDRTIHDYSDVIQACQTFGQDVSNALAYPPIPDSTVEGHWETGLEDYESSANYCVNGAAQLDVALIDQAVAAFTNGTNEILMAASAFPNG